MKLSIGYITSRDQPECHWFIDSVLPQKKLVDEIEIIIVSLHPLENLEHAYQHSGISVRVVEPKPCIWSGQYRITKENHWSKCNSINTFLCLAKHPMISMVDDRCVASSGFIQAIREIEPKRMILAGAYEKRKDMTVENGIIRNGGIVTATDARERHSGGNAMTCGGEWLFGCVNAMPLEYALKINGWPEHRCDGLSFEDVIAGLLLQNNGFRFYFDPRCKIIEDRTPEKTGVPMLRSSKERWPHDKEDKAHKVLEWVKTAKQSDNPFSIVDMRSNIQRGGQFPVPEKREYLDWFDGKVIE